MYCLSFLLVRSFVLFICSGQNCLQSRTKARSKLLWVARLMSSCARQRKMSCWSFMLRGVNTARCWSQFWRKWASVLPRTKKSWSPSTTWWPTNFHQISMCQAFQRSTSRRRVRKRRQNTLGVVLLTILKASSWRTLSLYSHPVLTKMSFDLAEFPAAYDWFSLLLDHSYFFSFNCIIIQLVVWYEPQREG